jgi:hemolysin activation/secretion protein
MRARLVTLAFGLWMSAAPAAKAQQTPADRLQQEQLGSMREKSLEHSSAARVAEEPAAGQSFDGHPEQLKETGHAVLIRDIELRGAEDLLDSAAVGNVIQPFLGLPLGARRIALLLSRITRTFADAGYITTRAYVGEQDLSSGRLIITVAAGRLERAEVRGADDVILSAEAAPLAVGGILQLSDVEQAVDQVNRARANQAKASVLPGSQPGTSVVRIVNRRGPAWRLGAAVDNQGQRATGRGRASFSLEKDGLYGLADSAHLTVLRSQDTWAAAAAYSIPDGYNTWSWSGALSGVDTQTAGLDSRTRTQTQAFSLNRLLRRDANSKTVLDASLSLRRETRNLAGIPLTPQDAGNWRAGLDHAHRLQAGHAFSLGVHLAGDAGLPGMDRDAAGLRREDPHAEFLKLGWQAQAALRFGQWSWDIRAEGQHARRGLRGPEQITAGGMDSVRGFDESAASGDRGMIMSSEWQHAAVRSQADGLRALPFLFLDAARITALAGVETARMASTGLGLRLAGDTFTGQAVAAIPVSAHGVPASGMQWHFSVAYQF